MLTQQTKDRIQKEAEESYPKNLFLNNTLRVGYIAGATKEAEKCNNHEWISVKVLQDRINLYHEKVSDTKSIKDRELSIIKGVLLAMKLIIADLLLPKPPHQ